MNDFLEWFVPCFVVISIFLMTFGFLAFMRFIHLKEKAVLAEYGLLKGKSNGEKVSRWPSKPIAKMMRLPPTQHAGMATTYPLKSPAIQAYVDKAQSYKTRIDRMVKRTPGGEVRNRLTPLRQQVDTWVEAIKALAQRADHIQQDPLIQRDLESVPQAIQSLETQLSEETEHTNKTELERTLHNYKKQMASLEQLQHMVKRAEIQIESTLSSLGTIYSQLLTKQSASHMADYNQLSVQIDEEVHLLQDRLEALQEVKLGNRLNLR